MATVLISNLAPIGDPEAAFFCGLIRGFERRGHTCILWSTAYHRRLARWFLPAHWAIDNWPSYFRALPNRGPEIDVAKWQPRVARLIKQGELTPAARLDILARATALVLDAVRPGLFLAWNPLCPHMGVAADICRERGVPVWLLERGMFPRTWYLEPGGLVGHSTIANRPLEDLMPTTGHERLAALGAEYLRGVSWQTFTNYAQAPVDRQKLDEIRARFPRRIAFFPPDDGTLGFTPEDHPDRLRTLPGYRDSFEAAKELARATDAAVLFKPHPSLASQPYDTGGLSNLHVLHTDFRILIESCDAVATTGSGLAFVALAQGKPLINLAHEWLSGKGIAYEAQQPGRLQEATAAALARVDFATRQQRFEVFVGFLLTEFLVSLPDASSTWLQPDAVVDRILAGLSLPTANSQVESCAELLSPRYAEFLEAQRELFAAEENEIPDDTGRSESDLWTALDAEPDRVRVIDFDHTLLLGNSTELFLATARPRWLAFLVALLADEILRCFVSRRRYGELRDQVRVRAVILVLPWTLPFWRRLVRALAPTHLNGALWKAAGRDRVRVASLGFRELIEPWLRQLGDDIPLTASSVFSFRSNLRRVGKVAALKAEMPAGELTTALTVTDSREDAALLRAVAKPFLLTWAEPPPPPPAYVPLRYTAEGKYPGKRILLNQHLGEDLVVLALAYAWSPTTVAALVPLFLAFFAVYEIGYYENDFHAAKTETSPVLSSQHRRFAGYPISLAWLWAALLSALGIWFLPGSYLQNLGIWAAVLIGTRVWFALYNRVASQVRIWLYPLLQATKGFCLLPFIGLTLPGLTLLVAQLARQTTNYVIYRRGGDTGAFRRQTHRVVVFAGVAVGVALATRTLEPWLTIQSAVIVGWLGYRVIRERFGSLTRLGITFGRRCRRMFASKSKPAAVIFGAGLGGEKALAALEREWRCVAVCDNNPAKRGTKFAGLPVVNPRDLAQYPDATIHLAAFYHYHEMYTQVRALGIPDERVRFFLLESP